MKTLLRAVLLAFLAGSAHALSEDPALRSGAVSATVPGATSALVSSTASVASPAPVAAPPPHDGLRPGVPAPPREKHGFFFAAYAVVWVTLLGYVWFLAQRVRALEQKLR